jgi:hypothetical protein
MRPVQARQRECGPGARTQSARGGYYGQCRSLTIARAGLSAGEAIDTLIVFIVVGSVTVAGPVLYYLIAGDRATKMLDTWKTWLSENNATVMFVLLVVMGTVLVGKGIGGISS